MLYLLLICVLPVYFNTFHSNLHRETQLSYSTLKMTCAKVIMELSSKFKHSASSCGLQDYKIEIIWILMEEDFQR
jgi:hypothetical protein